MEQMCTALYAMHCLQEKILKKAGKFLHDFHNFFEKYFLLLEILHRPRAPGGDHMM